MLTKLKNIINSFNTRIKLRKMRVSRYINAKRLSRINKKIEPTYTECKNCGEILHGMYCHKCGQYALDVNQSFWKYIHSYLDNTYLIDGRVMQTLRFLFTSPGFLSKEFARGRINSYAHPLKFYMLISAIFFGFVLSIYSTLSSEDSEKIKYLTALSVHIENDNNDKLKSRSDSLNNSFKSDTLASKAANENDVTSVILHDYYNDIFSRVSKYTPFLIMFLMPFYAYILYLSHIKQNQVYLHSFVFSIHIHVLFLIMVALMALMLPWCDKIVLLSVFRIFYVLFFIYNIIATKVFYERGWIMTVVKTTFDLLLYAIVVCMCVIFLIMYITHDVVEKIQ